MDQTPKNPRRPAPSSPDSLDQLLDEQPERRSVNHPAVDGVPQAPPKRSATLPQMAALKAPPIIEQGTSLPPPAPLPTELAKTQRAPSTTAATLRATPASGQEAVRIDDAPLSRPEAREALLLKQLQEERAKVAQLERDARASAEAKVASFPPPVQPQRKPSPVPESAPAKVDQAIGKGVRLLLGRHVLALLAAAGIGGGVTAVAKPSVDPAKADATLANVEAIRAELGLVREQLGGVLKREAARDAYISCLEESLDDVGKQLLPAQDKLGSAAPLRAYVSRCQRLRP